MDKTDNKKEEKQSPVGRELLLSADTSEVVPEQMMHTEEKDKDENVSDEEEE